MKNLNKDDRTIIICFCLLMAGCFVLGIGAIDAYARGIEMGLPTHRYIDLTFGVLICPLSSFSAAIALLFPEKMLSRRIKGINEKSKKDGE